VPLSAIIIAKNEALSIGQCLESLHPVADELLVLDTGSTDNTRSVAEASGARVVNVPWQGFAQTKNEGYRLAQYPYILSLDADEVLSPALQQSILEVKNKLNGAYQFARLNNYYGRWLRHGGFYPDTKIRLFHRDEAQWQGDFVHETLRLSPNVQVTQLSGDLWHYTTADISDHVARINRYSSLAAQEKWQSGQRFRVVKLLFSPFARFCKIYFLKAGFRDGRAGLLVALLSAWSVLLRYAKLWQLQNSKAT